MLVGLGCVCLLLFFAFLKIWVLIHNKILLVLLLRIILPYRRSLSFALQKVVQTALRVCHTSAFSWCSPARRSDGVHQHRASFSSPSLVWTEEKVHGHKNGQILRRKIMYLSRLARPRSMRSSKPWTPRRWSKRSSKEGTILSPSNAEEARTCRNT